MSVEHAWHVTSDVVSRWQAASNRMDYIDLFVKKCLNNIPWTNMTVNSSVGHCTYQKILPPLGSLARSESVIPSHGTKDDQCSYREYLSHYFSKYETIISNHWTYWVAPNGGLNLQLEFDSVTENQCTLAVIKDYYLNEFVHECSECTDELAKQSGFESWSTSVRLVQPD